MMSSLLHRAPMLDMAIGVAVFLALGAQSTFALGQQPTPEPTDLAASVSLDALLSHAENNAPVMRQARAQLGYAEASQVAAEVLVRDNPTLGFGIGPRLTGFADEAAFDFFVSLEQPIEVSGARGLRIEAAERMGERLDAALARARWQLRHDVTLAYHDAELAAREIEVAKTVVHFSAATLVVVQRRLAAGDASSIEVRLAEAELAEAQLAELEANRNALSAVSRLAELTGWPSSVPLTISANTHPRAAEALPSLASLQQLAATRHPGFLEATSAAREANAMAKVADREAWPTPAIGVELHREGAVHEAAVYTVLGTLSLELPVWQQNRSTQARARVDLEMASVEQEIVGRALEARVATAYATLTSEKARVELFESSLSTSLAESVELVQRGFEAGELPLHEATFAKNRLTAFQMARFRAYADYQRARAELEYAIGAPLSQIHAATTQRGEP